MSKHDSVANDIAQAALESGKITLSGINTLRRTFALLGKGAAGAAVYTMLAVKNGTVKIIDDGAGVFDRNGRRVH